MPVCAWLGKRDGSRRPVWTRRIALWTAGRSRSARSIIHGANLTICMSGRIFWSVTCRRVHEAKITSIDGGSLRVYPATHPAARQYVARRAELRWPRTCDEAKVLLALYRAHTRAADDWIPFDRYLSIETPWTGTSLRPHFAPISGDNFVCRGPDFLVRTYAKALEAIGEQVQLTLRRASKLKPAQPRVLHFGESYVVAERFRAEPAAIAGE